MKNYILLLLLGLMACNTEEPVPGPPAVPPEKWTVNLSTLPVANRYIDMAGMQNPVLIGGQWKGDRLVFRNVSGKKIVFLAGCVVESTHAEDAVAVDGDVKGMEMQGQGAVFRGGGLTFWGQIEDVAITGLTIRNTHTGIRATRAVPHRNITIRGVTVEDCSHEGFYIGAAHNIQTKGASVVIEQCTVRRAGWDAIQVGNTRWVHIRENVIEGAGIRKDFGQDYAITSNHCHEVFLDGNKISGAAKIFQETGARVFIHN